MCLAFVVDDKQLHSFALEATAADTLRAAVDELRIAVDTERVKKVAAVNKLNEVMMQRVASDKGGKSGKGLRVAESLRGLDNVEKKKLQQELKEMQQSYDKQLAAKATELEDARVRWVQV